MTDCETSKPYKHQRMDRADVVAAITDYPCSNWYVATSTGWEVNEVAALRAEIEKPTPESK